MRWLGQWHVRPVILPLELHEHQVPDFDKTVAIFIGTTRRAPKNMVAMVVKNLAARAAQGPVSPIDQKLSLVGIRMMR
jgi:hypothetical protein